MEESNEKAVKLRKSLYACRYRHKKREEEESILKNAQELLSKNQELSSNEKAVLELAEQIKDDRIKKHQKALQAQKKNYKKKREKEESILKTASELLSQNKDLSLSETEVLRLADKIKADRLRKHQVRKKYVSKLKNCDNPEKNEVRKLKKNKWIKQFRQKWKATATPEEAKAECRKNAELGRIYRQKRKATATPEEWEATRLKNLEQSRQYHQKRREAVAKALALLKQNQELSLHDKKVLKLAEKRRTDLLMKSELLAERRKLYHQRRQEKDKSILIKANELLSQKNREMTSEEKEVLKLAEKIKAYKLRIRKYSQQNALRRRKNFTPEEREEHNLRRRQYLQKKQEQLKVSKKEEFNMKDAAGWLTQEQNTSNLPLVEDEIKIENEVLQETTIKAIMAQPTANQMLALQKGAFNDSSSSWLDLSEKSFISGGKNKKQRYFQSFYGGSSYTQESFPSSKSSRSTKLDRRKLVQEDSFRCMRILIEATAKSDGNTVYGKQIAQKLRSCKKDVAEINIAKLLVDNILQNLTIGVYNSEKTIV